MRIKRIRYLLTVDILFSRLVRTTSYKDYFFSELLSKVLSIPITVEFTPEPLLIEIISGCFVLSVAFLEYWHRTRCHQLPILRNTASTTPTTF